MKDFWLSCGHHLLDRDDGGGLVVTDEFLKAYLARPELSASAGRLRGRAHAARGAARQSAPAGRAVARSPPSPMPMRARIGALMVGFRDHLIGYKTIEAAYLELVRRGVGRARRRCSSISSCT